MTLPKLLAMGQVPPPLRRVAILSWVPDEKYAFYVGQMYEMPEACKMMALGCTFQYGWLPATPVQPPEWQMIQPGGA